MEQALADKYLLFFVGKKRRYRCPVNERRYDLEYTAPVSLKLGGQTVISSAWTDLLTQTVKDLFELYPERKSHILNFKTDWSKQAIFTNDPNVSNHVEIEPGLFFNRNHTALHSCWLLFDLLNYFGINDSSCELIIRRMPAAEPIEIRDKIRGEVKDELRAYLSRHKLFSDEKVDTYIRNIDFLNGEFAKRKSGYNDLYLFDDANMYGTMKAKFLQELQSSPFGYKEKNMAIARRCLNSLTDFYRDNGYYNQEI